MNVNATCPACKSNFRLMVSIERPKCAWCGKPKSLWDRSYKNLEASVK